MTLSYTPATNEFFLTFPWRKRLLGWNKEPAVPHEVRSYVLEKLPYARYDAETNTYYFPDYLYEDVLRLRNRFNIPTSDDAHNAISAMLKVKTHRSGGAYVDHEQQAFYIYPGVANSDVAVNILNETYSMPVEPEVVKERHPSGMREVTRYRIPSSHAFSLQEVVHRLSLPITVEADRAWERYKQHAEKDAHVSQPEKPQLNFSPSEHQQQAIDKINIPQPDLPFPHGRILADEPGMGKTYIALASLVTHTEQRALIIVPASLREQWILETKKFAGVDLCRLNTKAIAHYKENHMPPGWYITSHTLLPQVKDLGAEFDALVVDEAHSLKNMQGVWHDAYIDLAKRSRAKLALLITGTPIYNNPEDLHGMLRLLNTESLLPDFTRSPSGRYITASGKEGMHAQAQNVDVGIPRALYQSILIRRKREEAGAELPVIKERRQVRLSFSPSYKLKQSYNRLRNHRKVMDAQASLQSKRPVDPILERITAYRRDLSIEKAQAAVPYIKKMLELGRKVLVFCEFVPATNYISQQLRCPRYIGPTPDPERKNILARCASGEERCLVLTLATASAGLNLQMFTHVVFIDIPWTYSQREQAEARAYRNGQQHDVFCDYLISNEFDQATFDQGEAQHEINEQLIKEYTFDQFIP